MTKYFNFFKYFILVAFMFLLVSCGETKYTLTLDANGGDLDGQEVVTITKSNKDESLIVELGTPIKNGYDFVGWDYNGEILVNNQIEVNTDIMIVAKYEIVEYSITYNLNGGELANPIDTYTVEDEITLGIPTKNGYKFEGWNEGVTKITKGSTGDLVLDANYSINEYTITYELNGGNIEGEYVSKYTINDEVILPVPVKEGFEFIGWYETEDFSGTKISSISKGSNEDKQYFARWVEVEAETYTITYELNGGMISGQVTSYSKNDDVTLVSPTFTGYEFIGWYETADFSGTKVEKIAAGSTGDKKFYAKWSLVEYTITYELNGGALSDKVEKYNVESENIALPTPIKAGYTFLGWFDNVEFTGSKVEEIAAGSIGNKVFYAKWGKTAPEDDVVYAITYELNGGTLESGYIKVYVPGTVVKLPVPTKEGYIFIGWFDNSSFDGKRIEKITATAQGDKKFYANWMQIDGIFSSIIPDTITGHITLYDTHPDNCDIKLSWKISDTDLLSNEGIVNQAHKTLQVTITMTMEYKGVTSSHTETKDIAPVVYDDLSLGDTVVGYVYSGTLSRWGSTSFDKIFSTTAINTLDVVNYGFATVDTNGNLVLENTGYTKYLDEVLKLRQQGVRVLLCIGENSKNFSNMTYDTNKMNKFVSQVIEVVEKYHFDGVDIDWEFPGVNTDHDVSIDRPNYTKLIKALRSELDKAQEKGGTKYLLTAAIPGTSWGSERYEMNILDNYLDYVNMMSYDLNNTSIACHHSSLHTSTTAKAYGFSVEYGVNRFVSLGFNKKQIVVGMAFYGKYYTNATDLGKSATFSKNIHYTEINKKYLGGGNYQQLWDDVAKAPYILNTKTKEYISYENVRSITEKCKYSKTSGIMGVMFWDYSEDITGTLMNAIYNEMK